MRYSSEKEYDLIVKEFRGLIGDEEADDTLKSQYGDDWDKHRIEPDEINLISMDYALSPEKRKKYIADTIRDLIFECSQDKTKNIYGGYSFSDAQMEITDGMTDEERALVGKSMLEIFADEELKNNAKTELFNKAGLLHFDTWLFVRLDSARGFYDNEMELMHDYFVSFTFDTKDEALDCFNSNKYLRKYPILKEWVKKDIIDYYERISKLPN